MLEFDSMVKRQRKWMLYLLITFVILIFVFPFQRVANGLLLGGIISGYNLWLLQRKVKIIGDRVAKGDDSKSSLGSFSRLAAAGLGTLISLNYNETFHLIAYVFGLMSSYAVIGIDAFLRVGPKRER